jgi:ATP-binding cassette, subfamily B, bacterial PglK
VIRRVLIYFSEIYRLAGANAGRLPFIFALFLVLGTLDLVGIGLIGQYVGMALGVADAMPKVPLPMLDQLSHVGVLAAGLLLLLVFAAKAVLGVGANYSIFSTVGRIEAKLRTKLLWSYQSLPYEKWVSRNSSEYINTINVWVPQYARLVLVPVVRLAAELLVAVLILGFLFLVNPAAFGMFVVLIGGVTVAYDRLLRKRNKAYADRFRALSTVVMTDVRQALDGFKEIRVLGAERFFNQRIEKNAEDLCLALAKSNTISGSPRFFLEFALVVFAVMLPLAANQTGKQAVELIPVVAMFGAGMLRLVSLFSLIAGTTTQLGFYRQIVHQLHGDLIAAGASDSSEKVQSNTFRAVALTDVSFFYAIAPKPILSNVSLHFKAGESIALFGPSGSGKSTIVDLMLGILQPTSGTLVVEEEGETQVCTNLAAHSIYLPQTTFLMDDTVRRNVALGQVDSEIDDEKIWTALSRVHMLEAVQALPLGLDTEVGDRGSRLSGGQRQRIALARALYFGRTVLFLDEATSAIDADTESKILDDLLSMHGEITLVVITHRVELVRRFDRVFRVAEGVVSDMTLKT